MSNNSLYKKIGTFLKNENIEYFNTLKFCQCEVINPRRLGNLQPQSCVVFLIPYFTDFFPERNVSLYSVSCDYHLYAKELEERLVTYMENEPYSFRLFADSSPINEKSAALKAGLGVAGENGLVINEKYKRFKCRGN